VSTSGAEGGALPRLPRGVEWLLNGGWPAAEAILPHLAMPSARRTGGPELLLLRQRGFALLWVGQLVSLLGDATLGIALPFYVYQTTGSVAATGAMLAAGTAPYLLFGSLAGVFVDRWDRKRTMVVADILRAVLLIPLLGVSSPDRVWLVYLVGFAQSSVSLFFFPAKSASIPGLVGADSLLEANSLSAFSNAFARVVGPTLGGALLAAVGLSGVIAFDCVSFLMSGVMISLVSFPARPRPVEPSFESRAQIAVGGRMSLWVGLWHDWLEGMRIVVSERRIAALFLVLASVRLADGVAAVVFPAFVTDTLRVGALEYGWLATSQAVGAVIGGLLIARLGWAAGSERLLTASFFLAGVAFLTMVSLPILPIALVLEVVIGGGSIAAQVSRETLLQSAVADRLRGRVFGTLYTTNSLANVGGMGLGTVLGGLVGAAPVLGLSGVAYLAACGIAQVRLSRRSSRSPGAPR